MGAWGPGSFENDYAMDFATQIESAEDLIAELSISSPEDPIDADHASRIVVVAECVAAMRGHPHPALPKDLLEKLEAFGRPGKSLFHHSRDHLAAVLKRSELRELWDESGAAAFVESIHDLIGRLNRKTVDSPGQSKPPVYADAPCIFCNAPLGNDEVADLDVSFDKASTSGAGFRVLVHITCLNRAMHPRFRKRPFLTHPEDMPEGEDSLFELLERKPSLDY